MNNHQNIPTLKPIIPIPQLKYNEIGIRSDLKGYQIKNLIDKIIFFLIYKKYPSVTLKSRGKGTPKLISIIDILQRKILGLYVKQQTYSTSYINNKDPNKEIKLPCMDAFLTLKEKNPNEGFIPPRKIEELEFNFIDPKNPPDFRSIRGNNNNFNNNINNNYNNYNNNRKVRGRERIINRGNRGFRPGFRGRGIFYNRGNRGRGFRGGFKNSHFNSFNHNFRGHNRGIGIRRFNRGGIIKNNNNERKEDEDYREFKGYNNMNKNSNNNNFNRGNNNNINLNNTNTFNHNNNNNFKNINKTENNFHQTSHFINQPINNDNNNNIQRNNSNNTNQIQNKMNMNLNINNMSNPNENNNNIIRPNSSSNIPGRGRGGIPIIRGRGYVMQLLGRGMPMRGKMTNSENENKMEFQKGL